MAPRRPLVVVSGQTQELPSGDTLPTGTLPAHAPSHATGGGDPVAPSDIGAPPTSRLVSAGTGLTGGGSLAADRTLAVSFGTTSTTVCAGNDTRLSDARTPTGSAGGSLAGSYPNPALSVAPRAPVTLTDASTIATDASLGTHFRVTLGGNRTLGNPTNLTDGQRILWELIQDGAGGRTISLGNLFTMGTDITSIVLSVTGSRRDFLGAIYNASTSKLYVIAFAKGY